MADGSAAGHRQQSRREEIANSISHGLGFVAAAVALPLLVLRGLQHGTSAAVGATVFALTAVLLYLTSTLYHAFRPSPVKQVLHVLDHGAIYLLIAGTYTPFTLSVLRGSWGWALFGTIWILAIAGVVLKGFGGIRYPRLSTGLYLAMGWLIVVAAKPLWQAMPGWGLFWLAAGGVAYSAGVWFYTARRIRYAHFIWHLFVLAGTSCHFVAVWRYAS